MARKKIDMQRYWENKDYYREPNKDRDSYFVRGVERARVVVLGPPRTSAMVSITVWWSDTDDKEHFNTTTLHTNMDDARAHAVRIFNARMDVEGQ